MDIQQPDEKLIQDYLSGNDASLEILVKRYLPRVYAFSRQYTGSTDNASDITQETFVKAWRNLEKFDTKRKFSAWILTIAKNTAFDWLRRKKETPFSAFENPDGEPTGFLANLIDPLPLPQAIAEKNSNIENVWTVVSKLPRKYSTVIYLRHVEDLSFKDISLKLQKPLNTVKSHYRRALEIVRKQIPPRQ